MRNLSTHTPASYEKDHVFLGKFYVEMPVQSQDISHKGRGSIYCFCTSMITLFEHLLHWCHFSLYTKSLLRNYMAAL